jgi:16S rRNA (guanine527-N7)-methyltransferase
VQPSRDDPLLAPLAAGTRELGMELDDASARAAVAYLRELERWNRAYNLTAIRDAEGMLVRHLLDSLAVLPFVRGPRVLDAGTGPGLPGIPLALAAPALELTLLDSGAKKVRFLRHVVAALGLKNVEVVHARLEDYPAGAGFDTVVARALAPLPRLLELLGPLCAPGGRILAMKGRRPDDELQKLPREWEATVSRLAVPGLEAQRHAVVLQRAQASRGSNG